MLRVMFALLMSAGLGHTSNLLVSVEGLITDCPLKSQTIIGPMGSMDECLATVSKALETGILTREAIGCSNFYEDSHDALRPLTGGKYFCLIE